MRNAVWLYGPPGSGKSTLANLLGAMYGATVLDADLFRKTWPDLGFSPEEKHESARRMLMIAENMVGRLVVACVTPYAESRYAIEEAGFTLVRVRTEIGTCKRRRPYLKRLSNVAGFDAPFEERGGPEVMGDGPIPAALENIAAIMGWRWK